MRKNYCFRAFGLNIESEFLVPSLSNQQEQLPADVRIVSSDLSQLQIRTDQCVIKRSEHQFGFENAGVFRVSCGNLIEVDPDPACSESHLGVFLMGSCMGAILHQRGYMPLHGSCVTDGRRSILITGDSGAGKSTLAAEFLKQGWKLLTDDVSAVYDVETVPMVQSSYPSQKLWQDALEHYDRPESSVHSLYFNENREKFGVDVSSFFFDGCAPLSLVVRLIPADASCSVSAIEGIAKADQLLRNTYRSYMIAPRNRQRHFQRCITLSSKIPMALAVRENRKQCADIMYKLITEFMEEHCHD